MFESAHLTGGSEWSGNNTEDEMEANPMRKWRVHGPCTYTTWERLRTAPAKDNGREAQEENKRTL